MMRNLFFCKIFNRKCVNANSLNQHKKAKTHKRKAQGKTFVCTMYDLQFPTLNKRIKYYAESKLHQENQKKHEKGKKYHNQFLPTFAKRCSTVITKDEAIFFTTCKLHKHNKNALNNP